MAKLRRNASALRAWIMAIVVAGVGLILLYFSGKTSLWTHRSVLQSFDIQLGTLLIVSVAAGTLWEWRGRRALADEVLDRANLAADLNTAGIQRVTRQYLEDVDWDDLFSHVRELDIFVAYGRTWRSTHFARLQTVARRQGARIRVVLPDPTDVTTIRALAVRFGMTSENLQRLVKEATEEFGAMRVTGGATIDVMYRRGDHSFSFYRFDDRAVMTLYSHARERTAVPTFVLRSGGQLYDFIREQFDAILGQASPAA